jgi:photosystem II stability/assembly factor-like uncharacterized protein
MKIHISFCLALVTVATVCSGQDLQPLSIDDDKRNGEEAEILQRQRWLVESRGLDQVKRPDLHRSAAVSKARRMLAKEQAAGGSLQWFSVGPSPTDISVHWHMGHVSGRVTAMAVQPDNESIIYLGTATGGVWKTVDGGNSWSPIFDNVGTLAISSVTFDPSDSSYQTIWVGTGESIWWCSSWWCSWYFGMGLFFSDDGGASFEARNGSGEATLDLTMVASVAVHPDNPQVVLAGGPSLCKGEVEEYGGLFRSTDRGASWSRVLNGSVNDVLINPDNPDIVYATVGKRRRNAGTDGIYRSTDGGITWSRMENGIAYGARVERSRIAIAPSNNQVLYALVSMFTGDTGLYRSLDGGDHWTLQHGDACDGQCWFNLCLAVAPNDEQTVLVGAIRFFRSTDAGRTLTPMINEWGATQQVHQDIHVLLYSQLNPDRFWIGCDGGVWRTDDNGASFVNLNSNLSITQIYDIAVDPEDADYIFAGTQDNSSQRTHGDLIWEGSLLFGDGFSNLVDPADTRTVYQTGFPSRGECTRPRLSRSRNHGRPDTFRSVEDPSGVSCDDPWGWMMPMAAARVSAEAPSVLFIASNRVFLLEDSGNQWTAISQPLSNIALDTPVIALTTAVTDGRVAIYAGTYDGRIHRCDDALAERPEWSEVTGTYAGGVVSDIAVDQSDPMRVFVSHSGFGGHHLFGSTGGGEEWVTLGAELPDVPVNTVVVDPVNRQRIFVGTDIGVFESRNGGATFSTAMKGLPLGCVVTDLEILADPHLLTAATLGRGAWRVDLGTGASTPRRGARRAR